MEEIAIPKVLFLRRIKALVAIEKHLQVNNSDTGVTEETAINLLGCKRAKLFELKALGQVKYKRVGRKNEYSRASIDKYNQKQSS
jgi:hypothetical protein